MPKFARLAHANSIGEPVLIGRPFSNFDFIDQQFPNVDSLRRIMSQVRSCGGQTMCVEKLKASDDMLQEDKDIHKCRPDFQNSEVFRLSFFTKSFKTTRTLPNINKDEFIGYAIIKKNLFSTTTNCQTKIYESVLRYTHLKDGFIRGAPKWQCLIAGNPFWVEGYLYAQQNGITNVCAHVAARTVASIYHKDNDMLYKEMNDIVGIDHKKRILGRGCNKGLDTKEIKSILESAGAKIFDPDFTFIDKNTPLPPPFQKYIYGSVESGFPAIVIFERADNPRVKHAIPIFGHTFNENTWVHRAEDTYFKIGSKTEYLPSESWVNTYIGHDDNWGSNFYIPKHYLHTRRECNQGGKRTLCSNDPGCVTRVIATFPKEVEIDAIRAEAIGADYLFSILESIINNPDLQKKTNWLKPWPKRLEYYWQNKSLVLRPILITKKNYSDHLSKISDWDHNPINSNIVKVFANNFNSENRIWMIELSLPELFSTNKRKLGEVLLAADTKPAPQRDFKNFLFARLLGNFYFYRSGGPNNPKYNYWPCGTEGHVELYGCEESKFSK